MSQLNILRNIPNHFTNQVHFLRITFALLLIGLSAQPILGSDVSVLPPVIILYTSDSQYRGHNVAYEFRQGQNFDQLTSADRLTVMTRSGSLDVDQFADPIKLGINSTNTETITLKNKSSLLFQVMNIPSEFSPSSLFLTIYENAPSRPMKVLVFENSTEGSTILDLPKGKYVLFASMTWLPEPIHDVSGYAVYNWSIKIV